MLGKAVTAIYRAALRGLERDLALLLAIIADGLVHFLRFPVVHV